MIEQMQIKFRRWLDSRPVYNSNEEAKAAGMPVGRAYISGSSHVLAPPGKLMKVV